MQKIYTAEMTPDHYTDKSAYDEWNTGRRAGNNHSAYIGEIIKILQKNENYKPKHHFRLLLEK